MMVKYSKITIYIVFLFLFFSIPEKSKDVDLWNFGVDEIIEFVENQGQFLDTERNQRSDILHVGNINRTQIYTRQNGISFVLRQKMNDDDCNCESDSAGDDGGSISIEPEIYSAYRIDLDFVGSSENSFPKGAGKYEHYYNYFLPQCPDGIKQVPTYKSVVYEDVYENIDFVLYGNSDGNLEYDFIVKPGADPSSIKLKFSDEEFLKLNSDGSLKFSVKIGYLDKWKPYTYQYEGNEKREVPSRFELLADGSLGFSVGKYDKNKDLVIDPVMRLWATYYAGAGADIAYDIAIDNSSNLYLCGQTASANGADLIATAGAWQYAMGGTSDAFVVKFNSQGVRQWGTYYGGTAADIAYCVKVDDSYNVYISGQTASPNAIATAGAHQTALAGIEDGFIAKFNSNGALQWGTYYGGTYAAVANQEFIRGMALDLNGNVIVGGTTRSTDQISTPGAFQVAKVGAANANDAFLAKFSSNGILQWGTYYGGAGNNDRIHAVVVDNQNSILVTGRTNSAAGAMSTPGSHQPANSTVTDAFITKFTNDGSRVWSTYYGGTGNLDVGWGIATDIYRNVYVTGQTNSANAIATPGSHQELNSTVVEAFLVKLDKDGVRQWATYYGGTGNNEIAYGVTCDEYHNVYICGRTNSNAPANAISTIGAHQATNSTLSDAFVARFSKDGVRHWGTYYGGTGNTDIAWGIAPVRNGLVYIAGQTNSPSVNPTYFIATPGSHQAVRPGGIEGFMACLQNTYTITPLGGAGGTILPSTPVTVPHGGTYSFSFVPDAGAALYAVKVDGVNVGQTPNYTFYSVNQDHTIDANFLTNYFLIRVIGSEGGSVNPEGDRVAQPGDDVTLTFTPDGDYEISGVYLNGVYLGVNNTLTISAIDANYRVQVYFREKDTDEDGATERQEKGAPNNGDGNFDGIPDAEQEKVASLPTPAGTYITMQVLNDCNRLRSVETGVVTAYNPQGFLYPWGLLSFYVNCDNVVIKTYFHDVPENKNYVYRKYGPTPPRFLDSSFYILPNTNIYHEERYVNNQLFSYTVVEYTLVDGQLGDDTEEDGLIFDPGGLSVGTLPPIPTLPQWAAILMGFFVMMIGVLYLIKPK